jgi:hypothetical protein
VQRKTVYFEIAAIQDRQNSFRSLAMSVPEVSVLDRSHLNVGILIDDAGRDVVALKGFSHRSFLTLRHRVASRQRDELVAAVVQDRVGGEGERVDSLLHETRESRVNVVAAARVLDDELQPQRLCRRLRVAGLGLGSWIFWVDQESDHCRVWYQLVEQL